MKKNVYLLITMICLSVIVIIGCKKKKNEEESILNPITAMAASTVNSTITVHWTPPTNSTPTEYKLYKDDVFIQTLTDTIFTENALSTGIFTYCVSAVYSSVESIKTCIIVIVPTIDYATAIAGNYLGDITLSISSDTIQDVSIILTKVNDSTVSFYVNQTLSFYGLDVPLTIDQQTKVTKSDENYNFSLTASVTVFDIPSPIPVTVTGVVTGSNMNLTIDINIVVFIITTYYQGTK